MTDRSTDGSTDGSTDRALLGLRLAVAQVFMALGRCALAPMPKRLQGEQELEFLLAMGSLAFAGAGAYSVDARLAARES